MDDFNLIVCYPKNKNYNIKFKNSQEKNVHWIVYKIDLRMKI